ncbi:putative membrane protein [Campylobacter blaseri]|uniref:Uncharacterized protein n=1 Tax=Campylobacter blaseri TaxID=2042961 RepID=A0A2P8R3H5_9BACT|nr:hypothetical protein [Campylobacter blaseri]PSM53048.1 hypothetical protein CQ405_00390 [Campylobacter blaseri]PSM54515.1 hypothetical protein CRN67_00390 [Campylobacter blaseri]QKF85237.1 putative membrane protein [Campylobacter blaseri]
MQTKFGDKLINIAKKGKVPNKNYMSFIVIGYMVFSLTVYLIPVDILDRLPFLFYFCKFMASFVPLIKELMLWQAPWNIVFYFSYMTLVFIIIFPIYIYKTFLYIFGTDNLYETSNRNAKDSPVYATLLSLFIMIFLYFFVYDIYTGETLTNGMYAIRGPASDVTKIADILRGGKITVILMANFLAYVILINIFILFFIIRLNFCTKLNIKRLKLKLFLLFCVFIGFIWVLRYYMVI